MSDLLRSAWLAGSVCKSLTGWQTKKGSARPLREYSISPDGDLLLRGTKEGALQLTKFLTYEDPLTAQLSDKYFHINCEFTPTCRSRFEAEHGKDLLKIKGALIQLREYEVRFLGSDGALSEKGITFGEQLATKGARTSGTRKSLTGSSKHNPPQIPIPVFVVQKFVLLACEGERTWGAPKAIKTHTKLQALLAELPRRKISVVDENGDRDKESRRLAQHVPGTATTGRREVAGDQGDGDSDDEDSDSQPFATQAPNKFSYFDDLDFETQSQFRAGAPTGSGPGDSLPSLLRVPQKNSRPLKRKEVSFEVPLEKSAIQPKVRRMAKLRKNHNSDAFGHNSMNGSLVLHPGWQGMVEVTEQDSTIPEDQEMELEKEAAWYPPQPNVGNLRGSTYNLRKEQSILEKHRPGSIYFGKHTARKTCLTQKRSSPYLAESEDVESGVSWPSSPEYQDPRFVGRDVTRTPPHSSMMSPVRDLGPSTSPAPKGRGSGSILKTPVGPGDSSALPKNGASEQLASNKKSSKRRKSSGSSLASSKHGSPSFRGGPSKRVTRGANGISKRVLPDPTNSVFKRPRKRPKLKKLSYDSADDFEDLEEGDYSDQSSGSRAREFSVEPPVPVIDPCGRTRVAKYGILGAQQVEIWDRNRKLAEKSDASCGPVDEDDCFSDTSFPDPDILGDLGAFKPNGENGTEHGFSQFVDNHSREGGDLRSTSCDVPPSLESNPMQSLLLSGHEGDIIGGKPTGRNFGGGSESFEAPLGTGHNKEPDMSDDGNGMPRQPPLLPSQTAFAIASSTAKQGDGQKEVVLSPELPTNPTKPSGGDQELDKGNGLSRLEDAPRNGSGLVAGKRVSLDAEVCSPKFKRSKPDLKEMYRSSSPIPAATVQVKETPYRRDGRPFLVRGRAVCMNDDSDQGGIPGTEDPLSTVQVPDSSQDQLLRENQEYRANLEVQVPASSDGAQMQKRQTPVTLSKLEERVPSSSDEIRRSKEVDVLKALKFGEVLSDSPISTQPTEHITPPFSPTTGTDKGPKIALSISVPRVLSPELTNPEPPVSVGTKAASIIDISSDEEVPAPTPPKPVNLREYLRANRAIKDRVLVNKEQLEPKMYADIRLRSLRIPGHEGKTEAEKQSEDEKRKKYFGTNQARPWNDPWKPVGELARLEKDRLEKEAKLGEDSPPKPSAKPRGTPAAEGWFRDPDTPVKVFLRKLKGLKQVENDAAGIGTEETHANE